MVLRIPFTKGVLNSFKVGTPYRNTFRSSTINFNRMKRAGLFLCFSLLFFFTFAQKNLQQISGHVFLDANGNGIFDRGEKGLKGIPVSNGDTIVTTSRSGEFSLFVDSTSSIFPILPANLQSTGSSIGNANFGYSGGANKSGNFSFGVEKTKRKSKFKMGAIGDVQVSDIQETGYANNSVMSELALRTDIDFNIFLGDLVNENVEDLATLKQMLEKLPAKSWTVAGNHDRDKTEGSQQQTFNSLFGAADYAFNYGDVHFIVLNNVFPKGKRGYEGRFTARQLRFVKNDLALVSDNKLVVIAQHIPMVVVKNKDEILSLLEKRAQVLIFSGHTHRVSRHYLNSNIMEIVAGASSGNWWTGERDWQGIPSALMQCGSPRNYFLIQFNKSDYLFQFKGVGLDSSQQMTIWVDDQDSVDRYVPMLQELEEGIVVANIYAGSEETQVRMQVDNGEWILMQKADLVDPNVARNVEFNSLDAYPTSFSRKAALRRSVSPHLWQGKLPPNLLGKIHVLTVEASEAGGFYVCGRKVFSVNQGIQE